MFSLAIYARPAEVDEAIRIVEDARMLSRDMFGALFSDCEIVAERLLGLPKSLIAIRR